MPEFAYTARTMTGQKVTGTIAAQSEREAISLLSGKTLFPLQVAVSKGYLAPGAKLSVKGNTMATTYNQLAALLRSGVPLLRSLAVLRDQTSNKNLKAILAEVHHKVEDGNSMADVMQRFPKAFSEMAINMVRAGQEGGFLEDALERVASFTELQEEMKGRTMSAIAYPAILGTVGSIVVIGLIVFFVPKFAIMFERLRERGELPWITDALLSLSAFSRQWGLVAVGAMIIAIVFIRFRLQTEEGRQLSDRLKLKMPIAGPIFQAFAVARFCRVLGTLLHNGVPILKALEISRDAAGNRVLSKAIAAASENISSGQTLAQPLAASGHFPKMVVEMIAVAEESNSLDKVLVDLADSLERRTSRQLDLLVRLLEPLMLVALAAIILLVVIALLVPIIKMSSALG
ncbi:Putative type II secretion system protein F [Anatilimnocola aggregata]|uniref:Type II secretion system protein F n=1 Tax=Anatilimnocola aggregata TaxID=2528021 RepID=A0A517Y7D5_9BACT|nr:type II secretion system F family protein [Anatilimnocola aggregata]QDU26146.1 Putative type II secretion system protein F [Anatilimnocola aggregata]